jgi:hypothetical protein
MSKMTKNLILYVYSHDFFPIFEIWEVVVLKVVEAAFIRYTYLRLEVISEVKF